MDETNDSIWTTTSVCNGISRLFQQLTARWIEANTGFYNMQSMRSGNRPYILQDLFDRFLYNYQQYARAT